MLRSSIAQRNKDTTPVITQLNKTDFPNRIVTCFLPLWLMNLETLDNWLLCMFLSGNINQLEQVSTAKKYAVNNKK